MDVSTRGVLAPPLSDAGVPAVPIAALTEVLPEALLAPVLKLRLAMAAEELEREPSIAPPAPA
jgi:hypothetical protein